MIVLDTNVVSELMKRHRDPAFDAFIKSRAESELFLPSVVVAEVRYGIERLPQGHRRAEIGTAFERLLLIGFASRIIVFDAAAAAGYASARIAWDLAGRPISFQDAMIGGMALSLDAQLATRSVADFDGYELPLINPWVALSSFVCV